MNSPPSNKQDGLAARELERAEFASVLRSALFQRSPKLSRLLSYLCEKHFRGEAGQITEYGIAVDVLERDADFNPQVDAVVRVDTHHLRKRLKEYYETEGRGHEVVISIPSGQYVPQFVFRGDPDTASKEAEQEPPDAGAEGSELAAGRPKAWRLDWRWLIAAVALVAAGIALYASMMPRHSASAVSPASPPRAVAPEPADGIRILAGDRSGDYVDKAGRTWLNDRYFQGGSTFHRPDHPIIRTPDPEIFQSGREGRFAYEIPLKPGIYELHLYFAETQVAREAMRGVNLAINGIPRSPLDVACDAGGVDAATMKIFPSIQPAGDGLLHLTFQGGDPNFVNAIEIVPGIRGKMRPLRFTIRETVFRDHLGRMWLPEMGVTGGSVSARAARITDTEDPDLYFTQRFGHFSYSIPVVEHSRYTVTMYFAETYFGLPAVRQGGIGTRVFDVYCNGTTLLKNFDILEETGGVPNRAVQKVFRDIEASPLGKLDITFVPVANYALVNGIEVEQQ